MTHTFTQACVDFWREQFLERIEDMRYNRITAMQLRRVRPIVRDAGEKVPTAHQFNRLEMGGDWLDALANQVMNASSEQIAQYAKHWHKYTPPIGGAFECPGCGYRM